MVLHFYFVDFFAAKENIKIHLILHGIVSVPQSMLADC